MQIAAKPYILRGALNACGRSCRAQRLPLFSELGTHVVPTNLAVMTTLCQGTSLLNFGVSNSIFTETYFSLSFCETILISLPCLIHICLPALFP